MSKKINLILLTLIFSMLLSCGSQKGLIVKSASNYYIDGPDCASVTVIRVAQAFGGPMIAGLHMDGELIAHMPRAYYTKLYVEPGEHHVGVVRKFLGGDDLYDFLPFKAEPGMKYFYKYSMNPERDILKPITEKEAEELIKSNKDYVCLNPDI